MIVGAAVKRGDKVWTGWRHCHIIKAMANEGEAAVGNPVLQKEQGFVTASGEFLNRRDAFKHAVKCGQVDDPGDGEEHALISEDLW